MLDQIIVFAVLVAALVLFVWGRWRYDFVALGALLALTLVGIVPAAEAFLGFGHPAVITVAAVLVVSRGLINSGVVTPLARLMQRVGDRPTLQVLALTGLAALCSGFMNNVGALALFLPVALTVARRSGNSPSLLLMPLAFGSLLGGLTTLIGTPPNIIIATFRQDVTGEAFRMFHFTPVGAAIALSGVLFIGLIGWRLVPKRAGQASREAMFSISEYLTELRLPEESKFDGKPLDELTRATKSELIIAGLIRNGRRRAAPSAIETLRAGDILIVEVDPDSLKDVLDETGLELATDKDDEDVLSTEEVRVVEAVITPGSSLIGSTLAQLNVRWRFGINVLAVSRQGGRLRQRLREIRFRAGDIILLQGAEATLGQSLSALGCLPLAEREISIGQPRRIFLGLGIFAMALLAAALGLVAVQAAFATAALLMILTGLVATRDAYESVDWPVIVLLGAMIPVGTALETTGAAQRLADVVLLWSDDMSPMIAVAVLLIATMFLSDVVNNAAAAVLMAPIAITVAAGMEISIDPCLMAVAVGASCAFLTPIGHQSNTLVLGPGGYHFGDYWRLGLPLEALIVLVATPTVLWVWPA